MTRARYLADFKQDDGTGYATKYATGFSPQFSGTPTGISATHITTGELPVGVTGGSGLTALGTIGSGVLSSGVTGAAAVPAQSGHSGKYLTTDATATSWSFTGGAPFTNLQTTSMPHSGINVDEAGIRGGVGNWDAATENGTTNQSAGFSWHDGHEGGSLDWPAYIAIYVGAAKAVNQLKISIHSNSFGNFELQGSNNANTSGTFYNTGNWTALPFNSSGSSETTQNGGGGSSGYVNGSVRTHNYINNTFYTHYRIWFKDNSQPGSSGSLTGWAAYGWGLNRV